MNGKFYSRADNDGTTGKNQSGWRNILRKSFSTLLSVCERNRGAGSVKYFQAGTVRSVLIVIGFLYAVS